VSSVFSSSLPYLRMVSSVLELIIVCGRCHCDGSNELIIDCHK
jgi:hypothetical protein